MAMSLGVVVVGMMLVALVALGASSTGGALASTGATAPNASGTTTGTGALGSKATTLLTPKQQQFAGRLQADTGLDPNVITAWLLAEESSGAAQSRDSANNNDWLNIGYTDSATLGAGNSVWNDPTTAADATANWIKGTWSDPGFGSSAPGIRQILSTVGKGASAQIAALQSSGWDAQGYVDLPSLYQEVTA